MNIDIKLFRPGIKRAMSVGIGILPSGKPRNRRGNERRGYATSFSIPCLMQQITHKGLFIYQHIVDYEQIYTLLFLQHNLY